MSKLIKIAQQAFQTAQVGFFDFKAGDTICIYLKIQEKNKKRIQTLQGVVIQRKGQTLADKTFTVRKISNGIPVEHILPVCLPTIQKIEIVRRGIVRRKRLFYLRKKTGQGAKIKHREDMEKKLAKKNKTQGMPAQSAPEVEAISSLKQNIEPNE